MRELVWHRKSYHESAYPTSKRNRSFVIFSVSIGPFQAPNPPEMGRIASGPLEAVGVPHLTHPSDGGVQLVQILCEVENHLNGLRNVVVVVEGFDISLELVAVSHYLSPPCLKRGVHVLPWCRANIIPKHHLLAVLLGRRGVFGTHSAALWVSHVLLTQSPREVVSTLGYDGGLLRLPEAICDGPRSYRTRGRRPGSTSLDIVIDEPLHLLSI